MYIVSFWFCFITVKQCPQPTARNNAMIAGATTCAANGAGMCDIKKTVCYLCVANYEYDTTVGDSKSQCTTCDYPGYNPVDGSLKPCKGNYSHRFEGTLVLPSNKHCGYQSFYNSNLVFIKTSYRFISQINTIATFCISSTNWKISSIKAKHQI